MALAGALAATAAQSQPMPDDAGGRRGPAWEFGAGVGALSLPDYRGSDERRAYLLPFPYLVYRGERVRVDRDGIRARLFDDERIDLDLGVGANFALRSRDNVARQGMPTLSPVVEIGPELVWRVAGVAGGRRLEARVGAHAAISAGGGVRLRGWVATPYLRAVLPDVGGSGFGLSASVAPMFGSRGYHGYLYDVDPAYATPTRPAYDAPGGYAGLQLFVGASRRYGELYVGGYLRADTLRGAGFVDSPLVRTRGYVAGGIAIAWVFGKSAR